MKIIDAKLQVVEVPLAQPVPDPRDPRQPEPQRVG